MSNKIRKGIAIVCGILLAAGVAVCVYTRDNELISTVAIFGMLYVVYLVVLSKKLKTSDEKEQKLPLRKK